MVRRNFIDDHHYLCVEVSYQRFAFTPAYEALGFPQGGQPFADLMGKFCCPEVMSSVRDADGVLYLRFLG